MSNTFTKLFYICKSDSNSKEEIRVRFIINLAIYSTVTDSSDNSSAVIGSA